ncbi:uncharacterized protein LOC121372971 [Gigantopelta aegis]|uniref:uncharacterized protein LOC121372971 n=1 Tax=Gigantopelta aegis TaxID=1735272 RepID=UPI001B88E60C|nr:uncharacterized protein LOC121372971 [Gigantopelta aegis]
MGFLGPFTIRAKILMQEMWIESLDWDDPLASNLNEKAQQWFSELGQLVNIEVPQCLRLNQKKNIVSWTVHTFVDASEVAYGAVAYVRSTYSDGQVSCRLVAAKTIVSPFAAMSISRLELVAAVLGLRLSLAISRILDIPISRVVLWTDSMNVLWWIRGRSRNFKPFVANRIGEIQSSTETRQWCHVPTAANPADMLSRGIPASKLVSETFWWEGPDFLGLNEENWPDKNFQVAIKTSDIEVKRPFRTLFVAHQNDLKWRLDPKQVSSWRTLTRVHAWVSQFIRNCQMSKDDRLYGELQPDEIEDAEISQIILTQQEFFPEEYSVLKKGKILPLRSKLIGLQPFIDEDGVLHMNGRLKFAHFLSHDVRMPIILPRKSWVTKMIVNNIMKKGIMLQELIRH